MCLYTIKQHLPNIQIKGTFTMTELATRMYHSSLSDTIVIQSYQTAHYPPARPHQSAHYDAVLVILPTIVYHHLLLLSSWPSCSLADNPQNKACQRRTGPGTGHSAFLPSALLLKVHPVFYTPPHLPMECSSSAHTAHGVHMECSWSVKYRSEEHTSELQSPA